MRRFIILTLICLATTSPRAVSAIESSSASAVDVVTIPIDRITGPGYRALRALEPDLFVYRDSPEKWKEYSSPEGIKKAEDLASKSLALPIERAMGKMRPNKKGVADAGFAVQGEGRDSLQGIYNVLVKGQPPVDRFAAGQEISVVFFAPPSMPVQLDHVERKGVKVTIHYALIYGLTSLPWHLSIIPLGKLPAGEYHVEMARSSDKEQALNQREFPSVAPNTERQIICQPFSFVVTAEP
jgi:hypothetical protein